MLVLHGHRKSVRCLAYSPTERLLASGSADKTVRLWDLNTGQEQTAFKGHRNYVHGLAFTPDGQAVAAAAGDLYLWRLATGQAAVNLLVPGPSAAVLAAVAFGPVGLELATADRRLGGGGSWLAGHAQFWNAEAALAALAASEGRPTKKTRPMIPLRQDLSNALDQRSYRVWTLTFVPGSRTLAFGTDRAGVVLWDLASGLWRSRFSTGAAVRSLACTADGRFLAAAEAKRVQVWDLAAGKVLATCQGHPKPVTSVAFLPGSGEGRAPLLLTGSEDETVRFWDATTGQERVSFRWPTAEVYAVAFAPDGMTAAAAGENGDIVVWDVEGV